MAWNEPGGNGDKDPWGNRGNQGPPDLDEVFKNASLTIVIMTKPGTTN